MTTDLCLKATKSRKNTICFVSALIHLYEIKNKDSSKKYTSIYNCTLSCMVIYIREV